MVALAVYFWRRESNHVSKWVIPNYLGGVHCMWIESEGVLDFSNTVCGTMCYKQAEKYSPHTSELICEQWCPILMVCHSLTWRGNWVQTYFESWIVFFKKVLFVAHTATGKKIKNAIAIKIGLQTQLCHIHGLSSIDHLRVYHEHNNSDAGVIFLSQFVM